MSYQYRNNTAPANPYGQGANSIEMATPQPVPYGTKGSGWSGSDTSRERTEREDSQHITGWRMKQVFEVLADSKQLGMTVMQIEQKLRIGHGPASSALSNLHRAKYICRLVERRRQQEIYVIPEFAVGRVESPYRPRGYKHPREYTFEEVEAAVLEAGFDPAETATTVSAMKIMRYLK